jgi:hypothetical protein
MKKIIASCLVILVLFTNACQKAHTNDINEEDLITQINLSSEFKSAIENVTEIQKLTKTVIDIPINYSPIGEKSLKKSILTESELTELLNNIGYINSPMISKKTFEFQNNILKVFNKFPILKKIQKQRIGIILINAYKKGRITNKTIQRMDMCSDAYADGMEDCDDDLGYGLLMVVGGSAFGGPVALAGGITIGGWLLYHQYNNCRGKVVTRWKRCRSQNPIG